MMKPYSDRLEDYVLQRALILAEGQQREEFYAQVRPIISALKEATTSYSRPLTSSEFDVANLGNC